MQIFKKIMKFNTRAPYISKIYIMIGTPKQGLSDIQNQYEEGLQRLMRHIYMFLVVLVIVTTEYKSYVEIFLK